MSYLRTPIIFHTTRSKCGRCSRTSRSARCMRRQHSCQGISVAVFDSMLEGPSAKFAAICKSIAQNRGCLRRRFQFPFEDVPYAHARGGLGDCRSRAAREPSLLRMAPIRRIIRDCFWRTDSTMSFVEKPRTRWRKLCSSILHALEMPDIDGLVKLDKDGHPVQSPARLPGILRGLTFPVASGPDRSRALSRSVDEDPRIFLNQYGGQPRVPVSL